MKILHLSDTLGRHHALQNLPVADIIIHSGDMLWAGTGKEALNFIDWFGELNYKHKIFIAGNHDDCFEGRNREIIQNFLPENYELVNKPVLLEI
jgi:predicted phosphohydrolase